MFIKTKFISDLQIYLIREQDPETGLSCILKDLSKTGTYKNSALFPSGGTYQSNKKASLTRCLIKWWTGQDLNL